MYEIFSANNNTSTQPEENNSHRLDMHEIEDLKEKNFDFKTDIAQMDEVINNMDNTLWQNIVTLVNVNHVYYECLINIMDTHEFQYLEDVKDHVALTLNKVEGWELIGPKLIASCNENVKKFGTLVNGELNEKLTKYSLPSYHIKLKELKNELAETKENLKIVENKTIMLQNEKRDLLNILDCYTKENVHRVSLEKQLRVEQENSEKLKNMINSIFKKKINIHSLDELYS